MTREKQGPAGLAQRLARRPAPNDGWRRATFVQPRAQARQTAREWFDRYPKAAYMSEVEYWRECDDGQIEFTMRRLPTAD